MIASDDRCLHTMMGSRDLSCYCLGDFIDGWKEREAFAFGSERNG